MCVSYCRLSVVSPSRLTKEKSPRLRPCLTGVVTGCKVAAVERVICHSWRSGMTRFYRHSTKPR